MISPVLLKIIIGKKIIPINKPIIKPPIWAKLSIYGIKPKPNETIIIINNFNNSNHGLIIIFQLWIKSSKRQANRPIIH